MVRGSGVVSRVLRCLRRAAPPHTEDGQTTRHRIKMAAGMVFCKEWYLLCFQRRSESW